MIRGAIGKLLPATPLLLPSSLRSTSVKAWAGAGVLAAGVTFSLLPSPVTSVTHAERGPNADYDHLHPKLTVLDSRALTAIFSIIRDEKCSPKKFAFNADRLMNILAEEGVAHLPTVSDTDVRTPCGIYKGLRLPPASSIAVVSVVRAGDTLLEAVRRVMPGCKVGKILIQRDESDPEKRPKLFYSKLPPEVMSMQVLLVDPMLATGGSACKAIEVLRKRGVPERNITFLNVVSCPEGLRRLAKEYPEVSVVTAEVDAGLNESCYIVPGLGDYGDRYYGTL